MNFEGRLYNAAGTAPLVDVVDFKFQIYNAAANCLLYEEVQDNVDLTTTDGNFALSVGSGYPNAKRTANDPHFLMTQIFQNTGTLTVPTSVCPAGTYTPATGESRLLRVIVTPHSIGSAQTLTPDYVISSAPSALVCESIQGTDLNGLIQVDSTVTQANMDTLTGGASSDASNLHNHDSHNDLRYARIGGSGSQNFGSSTLYTTGEIGIGTASPQASLDIEETNPTLRLGGSGSTGQATEIDFYGGAGASEEATIQSRDNSGVLDFYTGGASAGNLALQLDSSHNTLIENSATVKGTLGLGQYTNAQETTLITQLTGIGSSAQGTMWENSSTNTLRYWDGSAAQSIASVANTLTTSTSFSGDVTGAYNATSVGKIQGRAVASAAPSDGQVLTWVQANSDWEPKTSSVGSTVGVANGGTGLTSTPSNGQVPIGNGTGYTLNTIAGTTHQVNVTNGSGTITLSAPQNIDTTSSVQFGAQALGTATTNLGTDTLLGINTPSHADSAATELLACSAAANKGLVVQGFASQSANLTEWQNNSGTLLYSVEWTGTPTATTDLTNKSYVDSAVSTVGSNYIKKDGSVALTSSWSAGSAINNVSTLSVGTATAPTGGVATFNGYVGIGTTAPYATLTVSGNSVFDWSSISNVTPASVISKVTQTGAGAVSTLALKNIDSSAGSITSLNLMHWNSGTQSVDAGAVQASLSDVTVGSEKGFLDFATMKSGTLTEQMRIDNNGNVAIGNTSPGALLDVGNATSTLGTMRLEGSTSGYVQIQPAAAAGSWTLTLPPNKGTSGYFLQTDGNGTASWATPSVAATPAGSNSQVQFNSSNSFGASSNLTWDTTNQTLNATSVNSYGMNGVSNSGYGVKGASSGSVGVYGTSSANIGVMGVSAGSSYGVYGTSWSGNSGFFQTTNTNANGNTAATLVTKQAANETTAHLFEAQNSSGTALTVIDSSGNVGIGTTSPASALDVSGSMYSRSYDNGSGTAIDWSKANAQTTSAAPGALTFTNLQDGGAYSLLCTSPTSGTFTFSQTGLTFKFSPANGATTASTYTLYTFLRIGTNILVSWTPGFQ